MLKRAIEELADERLNTRKEGRKKIEEFLKKDTRVVSFSQRDYSDLFLSTLVHDRLENAVIQKKQKSTDQSNSFFFKAVFKHIKTFGDVSEEKVKSLLSHVMKVLVMDEASITPAIKSVYVDTLLEVALDVKYAQAITRENFEALFSFISDRIPVRTSKGQINGTLPRIVRAFCCALICGVDENLLEGIFAFATHLFEEIVAAGEEIKHSSVLYEAIIILIENHAMNHLSLVLKRIRYSGM